MSCRNRCEEGEKNGKELRKSWVGSGGVKKADLGEMRNCFELKYFYCAWLILPSATEPTKWCLPF